MATRLHGRRIGVCVGGGIAAYKAGDFVRELRRQGAETRVAMTRAATQFITPLTLEGLSGHPVLTEFVDEKGEGTFGHLAFSRWADAMVVLPATADLLARIRLGAADDIVTGSLLAFTKPLLLAPAMNTAMWDAPATRDNLEALRGRSQVHIVGPESGPLADGDVGMGRLAALPALVAATDDLFEAGILSGKRVLVTAGPTREAIDPARFLSNPSTGRMGLEVARAARALGAEVTVVLGPTHLLAVPGVEAVRVTSADEMLAAVLERLDGADYFVASAAVADFKPKRSLTHKAKKSDAETELELVPTPDVLARASQRARELKRPPVLIGFAAETEHVEKHALEKLKAKKLDFIVANIIGKPGAGFESVDNSVTLLGAKGECESFAGSKREVADWLWTQVLPAKTSGDEGRR